MAQMSPGGRRYSLDQKLMSAKGINFEACCSMLSEGHNVILKKGHDFWGPVKTELRSLTCNLSVLRSHQITHFMNLLFFS